MTKAAIPAVLTGKPDLDRALSSMKQNIDEITAQARNVTRLEPLPATASLADVIERLNVIVARLQ
jgi:hypothetical protein